jgi:cytochrome c
MEDAMPSLMVMMLLLFAACSNGNDSAYATQGNDSNLDADTTDGGTPPATFDEQVALGEMGFAEYCAKCHGDMGQGTDIAPRLVGLDQGALPLDPPASRKIRTEQFVTVGDVANFAVVNMPADAPGSLSTQEYLNILAFDIKANGVTLPQPLTLELADTLTIPR